MESTPSFVARDGLPLQGVLLVPAVSDSTALPAVVLVHGFSGTRLDLVPWGRELARRGFTALCIDTRGSGMEWSHGGKLHGAGHERVSEAPLDIGGAVDVLRERGSRQFLLAGNSLGAVKVTYTQAWAPVEDAVGIVPRSGPCFSAEALAADGESFGNWLRKAEALVAAGHPEAMIEVDRPVPGRFDAATFVEKYGPHGRYDWVENLWRVAVPKLVILGAKDPSLQVGAAIRTIESWERRPPECDVRIMPNWEHGFRPGFPGEDVAAGSAQLVADWWDAVRTRKGAQ